MHLKIRYLLSCLVLGLFSLRGFGQDTSTLALPQLWEQAFAKYPSVEAYEAQLRQATFNQKLTQNQYLPEVQFQAQNTIGTQNVSGGAFFPLPGIYNISGSGMETSSDVATNMYGSLTLDWKFMQFGKHKRATEAAEAVTKQASLRLQGEKLAIQAELSRTYFQLLFHQKMQQWALENTNRLQKLFVASQSMAQAGLTPGADSLLIKASLKQTEAALDEWRAHQEESDIALATWVNQSPEQLTVKNDRFFSADLLEDAQMESNADFRHPLLAHALERVKYAEKLKALAATKAFPSFSLMGGVQLRGYAPVHGYPIYESWRNAYREPVYNYLVGVGLRWNLDYLFDYGLDRQRHQEAINQYEAEAETVALGLQSRNRIAQRQVAQGSKQIAHAEQAFAAATKAYHLFETRYNSGLISISDLLQIQDILQNAEKTRIGVYYQYWMQQTDLAESSADFSLLKAAFK